MRRTSSGVSANPILSGAISSVNRWMALNDATAR